MEHIRAFASGVGLELTAGQVQDLVTYERLLEARGVPLGLIADSDRSRIRERHLFDCLRCVPFIPEQGRYLDLGSGAGLPGLVVAIARPGLHVGLVERRWKRAAFLESAVRSLGLGNVDVLTKELGLVDGGQADAATARALAPLRGAWGLAKGLLMSGGRLVYFAGSQAPQTALEDLEGAARLEVHTSATLPDAGPLVIITR